jgi:hypothetical protein
MKKTPGQTAYEGYCEHTGWKSLISGAQLPEWEKLKKEIQEAWEKAAQAVLNNYEQ